MKLRCCRTPDFDGSKIPVTTGGSELQTSCMQCNYKFSLQTGRGSTDAIFIISQIHENYLAKKTNFYILPLLILKKLLTEYQEKLFGVLCRNMALINCFLDLIWRYIQVIDLNRSVINTVWINNKYSEEFFVHNVGRQAEFSKAFCYSSFLEALLLNTLLD